MSASLIAKQQQGQRAEQAAMAFLQIEINARFSECGLKMHSQFKNGSYRFDAIMLHGHKNAWQIQWLENAFVFQEMF